MKLSLLTLVAAALAISGIAIAAPVVLQSRALEESLLERDVKIYSRGPGGKGGTSEGSSNGPHSASTGSS